MVFPWMPCYLGFTTLTELLEFYLSFRQYKMNLVTDRPEEIKSLVDGEAFLKSQRYNADKKRFEFVQGIFAFVQHVLLISLFVYPLVWNWIGGLIPPQYANEYVHSVAFATFVLLVSSILDLPWSLYFDFVIEERHGFNRKTYGLFFCDMLKSMILTLVIGMPVLACCIKIIKWGGKTFYIYAWIFTVSITLLFAILYPNLIAPLFNKYEQLKDEELRGKIYELAGKLDYPLTQLYQMDGSKRSAHSNAFMYGFWRWKRIVLFDTLLDLKHDNILAVLGHELGHWKLYHTVIGMAVGCVDVFVLFYLYGVVMYEETLYQSFGFGDTRAVVVGLFLFMSIYTPVSYTMRILQTLLSRRHEFQADDFARKLGYGESLKEALMHIHKENLGDYNPDPWYSWYHHSHPPLVERLRAIANEECDSTAARSKKKS